MTPELAKYLCDPVDGADLELLDAVSGEQGEISSGRLVSHSGREYPVRDGVPRFVDHDPISNSVTSFGDEWNFFNYDLFRKNWVEHVVSNTFGSLSAFEGKVVVDAGAGSGMQTRWISEAGAAHVIALELSHSVDGIMRDNLAGLRNVDVVQCSIDSPPLKRHSVSGIVLCHNVIQHTPSVAKTARALWEIVAPGGEFAFNCYQRNDEGLLRAARHQLHAAVRAIVSRQSHPVRMGYARTMSILRFAPILGTILEKSNLMYRGPLPKGDNYAKRAYWQGFLNTFDEFGAHSYQHYEREADLRALVGSLPAKAEVLNMERYFARPSPPGCAIRIFRSTPLSISASE